jgi:hypothetical protein
MAFADVLALHQVVAEVVSPRPACADRATLIGALPLIRRTLIVLLLVGIKISTSHNSPPLKETSETQDWGANEVPEIVSGCITAV